MLRAAASLGFLISVIAALVLALSGTPMPPFAAVRAHWRPSEALLLDRNGDPIHELRMDLHGRRFAWTPLDQISPALTSAIVAAEHHHNATRLDSRSHARANVRAQRRAPEIQTNLCSDRARTPMVEARNPGGLPKPGDLPWGVAGNRGGVACDIRQGATRNRLC